MNLEAIKTRAARTPLYLWSRLHRTEEAQASAFWGGLTRYHLTNDDDPAAIIRSRWLAEEVIPSLGIKSLLEVGANTGRNLRYIRAANPGITLKGTDVNRRALAHARKQSGAEDIEFAVSDANHWTEPRDRWDAVLTMSVLDHIPDGATEILAANFAASARHIIAVEIWDGAHGTRAAYKYSRNYRDLFERHGFTTLRWERSVGQYNEVSSPLWAYVGRRA